MRICGLILRKAVQNLNSFVFVSADLRTPVRMPVVSLMNYLAQKGYQVTVITNGKSAFDDYRYDYRIVRRSFAEPFRDLHTRRQILEHIAAQLPQSVFVMTNSINRTVVSDAMIIKNAESCASKGHKIVVWELMPFYMLLSRMNYADYAAVLQNGELFDAFVTCYAQSDKVFRSFNQPNCTYIPYFFPFKSSEYSHVEGTGTQILAVQTAAENYLYPQILDAFAQIYKSVPDVTLKFVKNMNTAPVKDETKDFVLKYATNLHLEDRISFAQGDATLKSLLRESAFAIVASADVSHTSPTVIMHTVRYPFILACDFSASEKCANLKSVDAADTSALVNEMLRLLKPEEREKESIGMAAVLDSGVADEALRNWEELLLAADKGNEIPAFATSDGETLEPASMVGQATMYHLHRTAAGTMFPKPEPAETLFDKTRKKLRFMELSRTQKYTYIQMSPQDVRRSQLLALSLLREFERICIKHSLTYYVAAGSLLGAARHRGQIPWDDDVDVTMPRKDYDKFIKIAQKELPDTMVLPKNNYPYGFHRMQLKGTNIERMLRQKGTHGVFLDILPLDGAAPTEKKKRVHELINSRLIFYMFESARPLPPLNQLRTNRKAILKRLIIKVFGPRHLMRFIWLKNARKYDVDKASEWVCLPGSYGYEKECFPKEYWGDPAWLEYEKKLCPVMSEWKTYLELHYGDFMQCPAELEKRTHLLFDIDFGPYRDVPIEELKASVYQKSEQLGELQHPKTGD